LQGSLFCAIPYSVTALSLRLIVSQTRYNVIYGTLGDLIFLLWYKLFSAPSGKLARHLRQYQAGEAIAIKGGEGEGTFFLLEGEADMRTLAEGGKDGRRLYKLKAGTFFGEIDRRISKGKSIIVTATTPISALVLPRGLFNDLVKNDTRVDRAIIDNLSRQLTSAME
jgi:CRP-like cAMP-binding protein